MIEESITTPESMSLTDAAFSMRLVPGTAEAATHFTVDAEQDQVLAPEEVEVEVKAFKLRFVDFISLHLPQIFFADTVQNSAGRSGQQPQQNCKNNGIYGDGQRFCHP